MDIIKFDVLFQSKVTSYRLELVSHALTLFLSLSVSLIRFFFLLCATKLVEINVLYVFNLFRHLLL